MTILKATPETIRNAAEKLRQGKLVAFPTETVYGLGADATNEHAVAAIFEAKGRPQFNPLIIHVAAPESAYDFVEISDQAKKTIDSFWPGPLTLVLPRKKEARLSLLASAGLDTVAVRFPSHPVAQALIRAAAIPIAAPSANASGKLSPTRAQHVADSLGPQIEIILDGGKTEVGLESTVLDLTDKPTILRHGGVTRERLEALLGPLAEATKDENAPKSPGMLLSHYAPSLPVFLDVTEAESDQGFLTFGDESKLRGGAIRLNLSEAGSLQEAAANLFAYLRELDRPALRGIAVAPIPEIGLGAAINDRLKRAAFPRS
jgi:L-threonylcarbamoyladenylate synthase